ncbi:MAG TPA: hypothetical protein PLK94_05220, partial [Alphaproteobacteria bacterium]|nr:hypothetical protein [Alphaproteobacteria bacterium]
MSIQILTLLTGDIVCAMVALYVSYFLRIDTLPTAHVFFFLDGLKLMAFTAVLLFTSYLMELYDTQKKLKKREVLVRSIVAALSSFILLSSLYYLLPSLMIGRGLLLISLACFNVLQWTWHITHKCSIDFTGGAR